MKPRNNFVHSRHTGFGLVEIMVGLVIGMIVVLIIVEIMTNFEQQKRTTTGGSDAQSSGGIALFTLQGAIQSAGFGLPLFSKNNPSVACSPSPAMVNPGGVALGFYPISIVDGGTGAGASDTIIVRSASSGNSGVAGFSVRYTAASNIANVTNNMACNANDTALLVNGTACEMHKVTAVSSPAPNQITLSAVPVNTTGEISCTGVWSETIYDISPTTNHDLRVTTNTANDIVAAASVPTVADIVNIQAQYGIVAAATQKNIVAWVDATGPWAAPTPANNNLIRAVRIAVVARNSSVIEKTAVTSACSSVNSAGPTGLCAWEGTPGSPAPTIDLSANVDGSTNPNWARYRYRVYETIVPIRNVINAN